MRLNVRFFDLTENFGFADQHRIEARRHAEEMFDRLRSEQRVHVGVHVELHVAVAEVAQKRFDLLHARLEVVELGVDFETAAGRQHRGFANVIVVAQGNQGLDHAGGGERVALPDLDRGSIVGQAEAD